MIIGCFNKLPIGFRGEKLTDIKKAPQKQPFVVLREATFEEWIKCNEELGSPVSEYEQKMARNGNFYLVSMD